MMDQEGDIQGSKARMPIQPIPDMTREMLHSCNERQHGLRCKKTSSVPSVLKACAEDELVKKEYKEMRCDIPGLTKSTFLMVFSPDGTKMASTHGNHNVYVTDLRTGKNIKTLVGHPRTPWCVAFHPSSNQILASGCLGGQVRIWDLSGGSEVWTAESQTVISSLAFHPVDRLLVIATYNELYFWDWSQPQPFMQTCTSNAKEKVRYVAFDPLGHKLITGIANTPQGFTRWERVRAPVPVARHSDRITAYRRRITPRLVPHTNSTSQATGSSNQDMSLSTMPERERRIAVCYRNLVEQYEMLVHRYLEMYRPTTTMDRGTDPMETEHLNQALNSNKKDASTVVTSTAATTGTQTITPSTSRISPTPVPGPSGLCRAAPNRANKRLNVCTSKSDSSTVYQSDSSSSSSSDESPTPKRRIPIIPSSNIFRNKSETPPSAAKNFKDSGTCTSRKKFLLSRPSAFHSTRTSGQNNSGTPSSRRLYDRYSYPHSESDTHSRTIREESRALTSERSSEPRVLPQTASLATGVNNNSRSSRLDNLPFPLGRLRGISEGSLSSADEVINFSERPNREPESDATENFTPDPPNDTEFPPQSGNVDNLYSHFLSNFESSILEARSPTDILEGQRDSNLANTRPVGNPRESRNQTSLQSGNNEPRTTPRSNSTPSSLPSISDRVETIMNQSDTILANLRRGMESLMEPSSQQQQSNASSSSESSSAARRIFILRKPSSFHSHSRQCLPRCCGTSSRGSISGPQGVSGSIRGNRYFRIRQPRLNVRQVGGSVWRPFDDHSYPRDPDHADPGRSSNVEPIRSLLTLSPRSPSAGGMAAGEEEEEEEEDETQEEARPPPARQTQERSSTPAPFPASEHNYPARVENTTTSSETAIADHTYPASGQSDYIEPLVNSLHSTINHISMQTSILRRQFESIELIDRARTEVSQLQELRRMWEEIRRILNTPNINNSGTVGADRRSNMSNVRQMLAWARISDPSSESAQSSTEQSEQGTSDRPSTSRSAGARARAATAKKRAYWRRRGVKDNTPLGPRRYLRGTARASANSRGTDNNALSELTVAVMVRVVEHLLIRQYRLLRDLPGSGEPTTGPTPMSLEHRVQSERVIQSRLRAARVRLNRLSGHGAGTVPRFLDQPVDCVAFGNNSDWVRYEIRFGLGIYVERLTRYLEGNAHAVPQPMADQIRTFIELALLLTDLLLLQIMESIPTLSGTLLDPERDTLSQRIANTCTNMLQNSNTIRSSVLIRVLHELRGATRFSNRNTGRNTSLPVNNNNNNCLPNQSTNSNSANNNQTSSNNNHNDQSNTGTSSNHRQNSHSGTNNNHTSVGSSSSTSAPSASLNSNNSNNGSGARERTSEMTAEARNTAREAMLDLNRQLRRLYQFTNYFNESETGASLPNLQALDVSAASIETSMSHVYRLGELLTRLRNVRGRLEQVSQISFPNTTRPSSNSTTEQEPMRSTDESPSDRESEPFEGFQSWEREQRATADPPGSLYRTSHINLYPPEQSSSQSSPEHIVPTLSRNWTIPSVHVNDVPVAEVLPPQPRIWLHRYPSELRPLSSSSGIFRPRFLIPLYAGVNPFEADIDDTHREIGYDGIMSTVFPNHRIQMWDISNCNIPNISSHDKNIVVSECKIHNDGSVDISSDGTLLVTLLPGGGGYLNVTNKLGIYSIKWDTLGQCLYTTSFEQNAISVSLSPLSRHLIVGLASRRVTLLPSDRWTMARIFLLDDRKVKIMGRGQLVLLRDLEQGRERDLNFMSVNCIKWMPMSGQGIVYATNTGQLKVLT